MTGYPGVLVFAGIGIAATVIMQSSHATLVLILAALASQQISYENALALAIGSNVGTTITAIIGSLGCKHRRQAPRRGSPCLQPGDRPARHRLASTS